MYKNYSTMELKLIARSKRVELHKIEQELCDRGIDDFVYITGVHKKEKKEQ